MYGERERVCEREREFTGPFIIVHMGTSNVSLLQSYCGESTELVITLRAGLFSFSSEPSKRQGMARVVSI